MSLSILPTIPNYHPPSQKQIKQRTRTRKGNNTQRKKKHKNFVITKSGRYKAGASNTKTLNELFSPAFIHVIQNPPRELLSRLGIKIRNRLNMLQSAPRQVESRS